jgi:MFS family permease
MPKRLSVGRIERIEIITDGSGTGEGALQAPARRLLAHRDFILFIASRAGNVFGIQMLTVAVGWDIYRITGSVLYLGLVGLVQFFPVLLLFLAAGMAADRLDRRLIIAACNVLHAAATALIGAYLLLDSGNVWPVLGLLALHGCARAFHQPASQSILPNIVPRELFSNAVAMSSSVNKFGQLAGPATGGILLALVSQWTYLAAAILFGLAAVAAALIQVRLAVRGTEPFGFKTILGGFDYIWRKKIILGAISIDLAAVLFGGVAGLLPVYAIDILKVGPEALGLMRAMPAAGALIVALVLAQIRVTSHMGAAFFISLAIFGVAIVVFSLSTVFLLSLAALAIYGAADMVSVYIRQTLVQIETPDELRGRVSSVNSVSINASNELGDFRAGLMAAAIGTVPAVFVGGLVTLAVTALWWKAFPDLRKVDRI